MCRRLVLLLCAFRLCAQESPKSEELMAQILARLNALEKENRDLMQQVRDLRAELKSSRETDTNASSSKTSEQASLEDQVNVDQNRIAEQAQTKVEASQKFPIQLNGMLLFNAFANSATAPGENLANYGLLSGPARSGATVRQTLLGLQFQGPSLPGNGRVNGFLMMDFWAGGSQPGASWLRIRRAGLSFDWENRSFFVGQDKSIISPYQPDSLAEVGIPPLSGAGNLWYWLPQMRYEERVHLGGNTKLTGQVALLQTNETTTGLPTQYANAVPLARPAIEGRLAFSHNFDDTRRFEIAPGFHASTTHVAGTSIDSRIGSLNWLFVLAPRVEITGTFYHGQNVAGLGALGNGFSITTTGQLRPVHASGGWTQLSLPITQRLTFNIFSGVQDNRLSNMSMNPSTPVRSFAYASNFMYRLGPNVLVGLEALQLRTRSFSGVNEIHNHYDLAIGYLF